MNSQDDAEGLFYDRLALAVIEQALLDARSPDLAVREPALWWLQSGAPLWLDMLGIELPELQTFLANSRRRQVP